MATSTVRSMLHFVRSVLRAHAADATPDGELVQRFVSARDEAAFELLVWRHAALVWKVCRSVLRDVHAAEDAFQAAFLTLARKVSSLRKTSSLSSWLYQVAYRIAVKLQRRTARRAAVEHSLWSGLETTPQRDFEKSGRDMDPSAAADSAQVVARLLAEIDRLPDKYRLPILLCYIEGHSHEDAARRLGWPKGTVAGRLARAREILRKRLQRQGSATALGLLSGSAHGASAAPTALVHGTVKAALAFTVGDTALVSARVLTLTQGVLTTMFLTKLRIATVVLMMIGLIGAAAGVVWQKADANPTGDEGRGTALSPLGPTGSVANPDDDQDKKRRPLADEGKKRPRLLQVPSPKEGILVVVGTEIKKDEKVPDNLLIRLKDGATYQRLSEGDTVEEGQLLARTNEELARNEVDARKAKLAAAAADSNGADLLFKEAKARLDRIRRLPQPTFSAEEISGAILTCEKYNQEMVSKSQIVKLAQIELKQAEILLKQHEIRSPVRGVIRTILKQRGEAVRALETVFELEVLEGK